MYNVKEKEEFDYKFCADNANGYDSNRSNSANNNCERGFDMPNNNANYRQSSNRADTRYDTRYDSAGNMRNSSYQSHGNNSIRLTNSSEYSSLNRYYGTPQVVNGMTQNTEKTNRVVTQNQNSTATPMRNSRVTQMPDYEIYNNSPKIEKKKLSLRKKVCILVICAVISFCLALTIANVIPNANAQSANGAEQEVAIDKNVGKVVDENGGISDVSLVQSGGNYNYDTKTNWFDGFCDWIENLVG